MTHRVVPVGGYVLVFLALMVLTTATVAISFLELGEWNFVVAIAIAICKASLVIWFFMHLNHASALTKLFAGAGFFWMLILIALTLSDYHSRGWLSKFLGPES